MHIVAIAWIFVVVLMALAEATSTQGTVLGALFTLLLYGALPLSIVLYVMNTPYRKRARRAAEAQELALLRAQAAAAHDADSSGPGGDGGSQPAGAAVAAERKEA